MANSYMLEFENSENPYELRRQAISIFISENESKYVSIHRERDVIELAEKIMATGVKYKDVCHVVCQKPKALYELSALFFSFFFAPVRDEFSRFVDHAVL